MRERRAACRGRKSAVAAPNRPVPSSTADRHAVPVHGAPERPGGGAPECRSLETSGIRPGRSAPTRTVTPMEGNIMNHTAQDTENARAVAAASEAAAEAV